MGLAWERGWDWWGSFFSWRLGEGGDGVEGNGMVWGEGGFGEKWLASRISWLKMRYEDKFLHEMWL